MTKVRKKLSASFRPKGNVFAQTKFANIKIPRKIRRRLDDAEKETPDPRTADARKLHPDGFTSVLTRDGYSALLSFNLKNSSHRMDGMMRWIDSCKNPPIAVLIQDPPLQLAFRSMPTFDRWFTTEGRALTEEDYHVTSEWGKRNKTVADVDADADKENTQKRKLGGVAFLVHNTASSLRWYIDQGEEKLKQKVATLRIPLSDHCTLAIHNIYNRNQSAEPLDFDALSMILSTSHEIHILMGDFNIQLYEKKHGRNLAETMIGNDMIYMNNLNEPTWCRTNFDKDHATKTVIDYAFVQNSLAENVKYQLLKDVPGFDSDHRVTQLDVKMDLELPVSYRPDWKAMDEKRANEMMKELIQSRIGALCEAKEFPALNEADEKLDQLIGCLTDVMDKLVPLETRYEESKIKAWMKSQAQPPQDSRKKQSRPSHDHAQPHPSQDQSRTDAPQQHPVAQNIKRGRQGILPHAVAQNIKRVRHGMQPKNTTHIQEFRIGDNVTGDLADMEFQYLRTVFGESGFRVATESSQTLDSEEAVSATSTSTSSSTKTLPDIPPFPDIDLMERYESLQHLIEPDEDNPRRKDELLEILGHAPNHKAAGPDDISYDLLKAVKFTIAPVLTRIINTFLRYSHYSDRFRSAIILAIYKPGKPRDHPKSYRPVALACCLAKIYERILMNRLTELVKAHPNLLPAAQFGAPGRNTALATERLINFVHTQWALGKKVTLYSLDLSGAYDCVYRGRLLDIMNKLGLPVWIIKAIWAFLSNRRVKIRFPSESGDKGGTYMVNVGVPQGSPLSSILFAIYAAALIDERERKKIVFVPMPSFHDLNVDQIAYVDDIGFAIASDSHEQNNMKFVKIHEDLLFVADNLNFKFSPEKYQVYHFQAPHSPEKDFNPYLLPLIPEFDEYQDKVCKEGDGDERLRMMKKICPENIRVLGLILDRRLKFIPHCRKIQRDIRISLSYFRRQTRPTKGVGPEEAREYYLTNIQSKFLYCAQSWFMYWPGESFQWGLSKEAINILESTQHEACRTLLTALVGTVGAQLVFLMCVPFIEAKLSAVAMANRAKRAKMPEHAHNLDLIRRARNLLGLGKSQKDKLEFLAYPKLYEFASSQFDAGLKKSKFKESYDMAAIELSVLKWDASIPDRLIAKAAKSGGLFQMSLVETMKFTDLRPTLYIGLDRAQLTMAVYLLTGNIPLTGNPVYFHLVKARKDTENDRDFHFIKENRDKCPRCRTQWKHDPKHLFFYCESLKEARAALFTYVPRTKNLAVLMNEQNIRVSTSWAIRYFDIEVFKGRRFMYGFD